MFQGDQFDINQIRQSAEDRMRKMRKERLADYGVALLEDNL